MRTRRQLALGLLSTLLATACGTSANFRTGAPQFYNGSTFRTFQNTTPREQKVVVRFDWQNRQALLDVSTSGFDLYGIDRKTRTARARVTPDQLEYLKTKRIPYRIIFEPGMETRRGLPEGYMSFDEMVQKMKTLAQQYPNLITMEDIGDTWEKQQGKSPTHDIWAVTLTNKQNGQGQKPLCLFTAGVHARELAPVELLMKMAEHLVLNYGKDPQVTQLMDTRQVMLIPMVNVDGRVEVEKGDSWQRKNTHGTGVDLNRNFDTHWNYDGLNVPSSWKNGLLSPNSETYSGPHAASEVETQAVQNVYKRYKVAVNMDIHSYGDMFFWPVGYSEDDIPEAPAYRKVWENTFKKIGFSGGTSMGLLYPTTGTTDDYGYAQGAFSMGMEVGNSFRPSFRETERMWETTRPHFMELIRMSTNAGALAR